MRRFFELVERFRRDEHGAFAVIFGVMAIALVALSGAVVDYVTLQQARSRAQVALDAAALALQQEMQDGMSDAEIKVLAQSLLTDRIADAAVTSGVTDVISNKVKGSLALEAELTVPTVFVSLVGVTSVTAQIFSEVIRRKNDLEVVMVLDNSGSMNDYFEGRNEFRMTNLVNAARSATEILFAKSSSTDPNVKIGIVPFTQYVNVGTNNANAAWLNRSGSNAIVRDNFDDDANLSKPFNATTPAFDRISLFGKLAGSYTWGGCVEARQTPYDTDDTPPNTPATRFVPLFAPDEPDEGSFSNNYLDDTPSFCTNAEPICTLVRRYNNYSSWFGFSGLISSTYTFTPVVGQSTNSSTSCPQAYDDWIQKSSSQNTKDKTITTVYYSARVRQERICKYNGGVVTKSSRSGATGPNVDCPIHPVLPLTFSKTNVLAAIEKMRPQGTKNQPEGGTNIAQGAIWGLHALSRSQPFNEGLDYGDNVTKVMILMTDGDNFHKASSNMNGSLFFPAYGYPYNNTTRTNAGRLGQPGWSESKLMEEMNARTLASCASAKAADIEIFTIGLYSSTQATIQMLKDCASGEGHYYPATATNLSEVFEAIARQLQPLVISR
jgi:Flp pilus assembly protein TadG